MQELPCLKPKLEVTFSKHLESFHDGEPQRFPLLADVFAEFPNMPVNIDIKDNDDKLIEEVFHFLVDFVIFLQHSLRGKETFVVLN